LTNRFILWIFFLTSFASSLAGENRIVITNPEKFHFYQGVSWLADSAGQMNICSVKKKYAEGKFLSLVNHELNLKPFSSYWLRFEIVNHCKSDRVWMLFFRSQISHVTVYGEAAKDTSQAFTVEHFNNISRNRVTIQTPLNQPIVYYLKISNRLYQDITINQMQLVPNYEAHRNSTLHGFIVGLTQGGLLFMLAYIFFQYINFRQRFYLFYLLYILANIVFSFLGTYLVDYFIAPRHPLESYMFYPASFFAITFYLLFVRDFIEPSNLPSGVDKWVYKPFIVAIILFNCLVIAFVFISEKLFWVTVNSIFIYATTLGFVLIIYIAVRIKSKITQWVLFGSAVYCIFGFMSFLHDIFNFQYDNHWYNVGLIFELLIFTYAINLKQKLASKTQQQMEIEHVKTKYALESRQRELTQKAMHITQQEQILASLRTQLIEIKPDSIKDKASILQMLSDIELYLRQNSWDDFALYFNEVDPGFYAKLKERYPDLTQNELQICALLRLNLNTKKISEITRKTPKSIEVMRTRIRAKMNLSRDENLFDIISDI
jgi:DNA-binding CsgD family transcriptional regulator